MGVQGLWKLIAPCGKMVPLEGMSNKVLAIGVWDLHLIFSV